MRLAIAVGILVSTTTTCQVVSSQEQHQLGKHVEKRGPRGRLRPRAHHSPGATLQQLRQRLVENGRLVNTPNTLPSSENKECDPDVGVLSCGIGSYCIESEVGGVCGSLGERSILWNQYGSRRLEDQGNETTFAERFCDDKDLKCQCQDWDEETQTGVIECDTLQNYCLTYFGDDCKDTCASVHVTYELSATNYRVAYTYEFKSPDQEQQTGRIIGNHNSTGYYCSYSVNGVNCSSCEFLDGCTLADCTNTDRKDLFCLEEAVPPMLRSCYFGDDYHFNCEVCGYLPLLNPRGPVTFPSGKNYYCDAIETDAMSGDVAEDECSALYHISSSTCCNMDQCHVCPWGVENPDATVDIPGWNFTNCTALADAGRSGVLGDATGDTCRKISAQVAESCCGVPPDRFCPLCGEAKLRFPTSTFDKDNETQSCLRTDLDGRGGLFEADCFDVQIAADESCCARFEDCRACPKGEDLTSPNAEIEIPDVGNFTCEKLDKRARNGAFFNTECQIIQDLAYDTCGCMLLAPTDPPTVAPDVDTSAPTSGSALSYLASTVTLSVSLALLAVTFH